MAQYQVYIKAEFLFDVLIDAENFNEAAVAAMKKFLAKNGIRARMAKAFSPGDFIDGNEKVTAVYNVEED